MCCWNINISLFLGLTLSQKMQSSNCLLNTPFWWHMRTTVRCTFHHRIIGFPLKLWVAIHTASPLCPQSGPPSSIVLSFWFAFTLVSPTANLHGAIRSDRTLFWSLSAFITHCWPKILHVRNCYFNENLPFVTRLQEIRELSSANLQRYNSIQTSKINTE